MAIDPKDLGEPPCPGNGQVAVLVERGLESLHPAGPPAKRPCPNRTRQFKVRQTLVTGVHGCTARLTQ
jgi:hypothetical protein